MAKFDFESSLKLTRISLLICGIKISKKNFGKTLNKFIDFYLYYFNLIWLYTNVLAEVNWLVEAIIAGRSFVETSLLIPCVTIGLVATSKTLPLYLNRNIIVKVVDKLRDLHPEISDEENNIDEETIKDKIQDNDAERQIVKESATMIKLIVLMQYYVCAIVVFVFPLMPIISMLYEYCMTGNLQFKYPYLANYFFDIDRVILWPFVYFHQFWGTSIVGLNVFGSDTLFYAACVYIQMHFRLLCHRLEHVVSRDPEQTRRNLMSAVKRHQELIHLVNQMEVLYSKSILFNILTSSFLMCLSGFIIMMLEDVGVVISFATFFFHDLSQISLLCYFGDLLMRSSTQISTAIFNSKWYETDEKTKKIMFIILIRAQRPCKLTASNFSDLNLSTFTTILSRSWSYFALLKTMYKP